MYITAIQNQMNSKNNNSVSKKRVSSPALPQNDRISNIFYYPMSFKGLSFETKAIKNVVKNMFPKLGGVFTPDEKYIDLSKITYDNLLSQKLDITKASKNEITGYRTFLALLESYAKNPEDSGDFATQWVKKYNPDNMSSPLAPLHFLSDMDTQESIFAINREILKNPQKCKSLDVAVFDKNGNFDIDAVVFDTETTGTHINKDKIVQIGAALLEKGKITKTINQLINPEIHIPEGASAVNGITDDMVKDAPKIEEYIGEFLGKVMNKENGIIVTWNGVKFDIPLLNRVIRDVRVANDINPGKPLDKIVKEKQLHKVIDAQILHQRIHPFLGASKKLSQQYHWLYCKPMENAHDALADVGGTISMFKYDLYWLNKHRIDETKPLTLRQVLLFQNGEPEVPNLDIKLHPVKGFNQSVDFSASYKKQPLNLEHYFDKYDLNEKVIDELASDIGEENVRRFKESDVINSVIDDIYKGHPLQASETKKIPRTDRKKSIGYEMRKNLETLFDIAKIEGFNGKSKEEIRDLIAKRSMTYTNSAKNDVLSRGIWQKNTDPAEISSGNDLPDDEIAKRVMKETE